MSAAAFTSLFRAMLLGFVRDRRALIITVFFPLFLLILFGGLLGQQGQSKTKIAELGRVAVLDQAAARDPGFGAAVQVSHYTSRDSALAKVRKGDLDAVVEQNGDRIISHYSAADPVTAGAVQSVLRSAVRQSAPAQPVYQLTSQRVEDESLKPIQYYTPGLLGWAIASASMFGASATMVTWRTKGLLRRLRLSPVATTNLFGARIGVSLGIAMVQAVLFIGVATTSYFGLKLAHDWWMSVPVVLVGTLSFLSIGMLIGAWASSQEAAQTATQLVVLPMAFLGGSFFPLDAAPAWLRAVSNVFPLRHLNDAMLNVMARGEGPASVLPQLGVLLAFTIVACAVAVRIFRWERI